MGGGLGGGVGGGLGGRVIGGGRIDRGAEGVGVTGRMKQKQGEILFDHQKKNFLFKTFF